MIREAREEISYEDVFAFMRDVQAVKINEEEAEKEARLAQRALDAQVEGKRAKRKKAGA